MNKEVVVLGIRGVPAQHGGFETFAEVLSLYLVQKGWKVTVYCQEDGAGDVYSSEWKGIHRVHIPVNKKGPLGTVIFDLKSIWHARRTKILHLTLGYNTAVFNLIQRLFNIPNVINMDGIEWKRNKWGKVAKTWFWLNERFGCWFGSHLIADHPAIEEHLQTRVSHNKITMIPYGASLVTSADESLLKEFGVTPKKFSVVIARPEPENSILEIVKAFSKSRSGHKLVVLGHFDFENNDYHRSVLSASNADVVFPGAVYEASKVAALRYYSRFYIHGHQVGGTNPSLVEALGAGSAVIAHNNKFNRWVAGDAALYFSSVDQLIVLFDELCDNQNKVELLEKNALANFTSRFSWESILSSYESLLTSYLTKEGSR